VSKVFTRGPARPHAGKARTRPLSPSKWVHKLRRSGLLVLHDEMRSGVLLLVSKLRDIQAEMRKAGAR
jgi:hypothetical protein